jgi:hypothetical protein
MPPECSPITRSLYAWEIQEVQRVFGTQLAYERVRVHECTAFPDTVDRLGRMIKRMPAPTQPNAITLGTHSYFPIRLLEALVPPTNIMHYQIGWLIHELTHVWQYQKMGWGYLYKAVKAQIEMGAQAYDFGGEAGLLAGAQNGQTLKDFNLEQQGDICRTYYNRLAWTQDVGAWMPYIAQIQGG